jgi:hypothetical protein
MARDPDDVHQPDPADARALFQHENVLLYSGKVDTYRNTYPRMADDDAIALEQTEEQCRFFREAGAGDEEVYVGVREESGVGVMEVCLASTLESWDGFSR